MAFEVPNHLPRRGFIGREQSIGSISEHYDNFVAKIERVSPEKLDSSIASSWVHELTGEIQSTLVSDFFHYILPLLIFVFKATLHAKISENFPDFERQLEASRGVVAKVNALANDTRDLSASLYDNSVSLTHPFQ